MPHSPRFVLDNGDLAISGLIAQGHHTADPQALTLGGSDLVADALGGDLALELRYLELSSLNRLLPDLRTHLYPGLHRSRLGPGLQLAGCTQMRDLVFQRSLS